MGCLTRTRGAVFHVDAHTAEEDETKRWNAQVDQLACVGKVDTNPHQADIQMLAKWAHEKAGHVGYDATVAWAKQRGVHIPSDVANTIVHMCEVCPALQNKGTWVQPVGQIQRRKGPAEVWQIDYIGPLPEHS